MAKKAGMATGTEVARITVKVSPDTREFRRELKRDLDKVEKESKSPSGEAKVGVGAETKKMKEDVQRASKGLSAEVGVSAKPGSLDRFQRRTAAELQSGMNRLEAKINLSQTGESFRRDIEKAASELEKLIKSPIPDSLAGASDRRTKIREEIDALKQLGQVNSNTLQLKVDPLADFKLRKRLAAMDQKIADDKHKQQLSDWKDELRHMKMRETEARKFVEIYNKENPPLQLKLDPQFDYKLRQRLAKIKPKVDVDVDVDKGRLAKLGSKISSIGSSMGSTIGKLATSLPSFGSGINPMGYALIAVGVLTVAAPLVGLITTALLALPGVVSLIAAPIAAITLGLDGFKKAAEAIKPQFDELKKKMSDVAQSEFTPVLQRLADTVFPLLERSLPNVTKGLANMSQGVLDALSHDDNAGKLEGSINRIATALNGMRPGVDGFTSGFIGLIDQFSLKLPAIKDWFNQAGIDFDNWVKKISADGSLSTAFDGLGGTIKTILGLIGDLGTKGIEFMGDPEKVNKMVTAFQNLANIIDRIVGMSSKFFEFLDRIENSRINQNLEGKGLAHIFDGVDPVAGSAAGGPGLFDDMRKVKEEAAAVEQQATKSRTALEGMLTGGGAGAPAGPSNPLDAIKNQLAAPPPAVTPPDTAPAETKLTEYQGFVDTVTAQVRGSLQQATSGESLPAPNFESFKAAWAGLPTFVSTQVSAIQTASANAMTGVVAAFTTAGGQIMTEVQSWPGKISTALEGLYGAGQTAGTQLANGLAAGIDAGHSQVITAAANIAAAAEAAAKKKLEINSPSKVFERIGLGTGEGFVKGMEGGAQPVIDQAKALAQQVSDAFASGADPTTALDGINKSELKRIEKTLGLEIKKLEAQAKALDYQAKTTGNKALKDQAAAIRLKKEELGLQKDMLDLAGDYNDETSSGAGSLESQVAKMLASPVDFAKATGKQFLSDIGISGEGFVSKALTEGTKYIFNVGSVDEAISLKERQDSIQGLPIIGRT